MSQAYRKEVACDKIVPCKAALRLILLLRLKQNKSEIVTCLMLDTFRTFLLAVSESKANHCVKVTTHGSDENTIGVKLNCAVKEIYRGQHPKN